MRNFSKELEDAIDVSVHQQKTIHTNKMQGICIGVESPPDLEKNDVGRKIRKNFSIFGIGVSQPSINAEKYSENEALMDKPCALKCISSGSDQQEQKTEKSKARQWSWHKIQHKAYMFLENPAAGFVLHTIWLCE